VRFDVFTAVRMMMFFWVLAPYRIVGRCQRFGETYYLHLQAEAAAPKLRRATSVSSLIYLKLKSNFSQTGSWHKK
jgi:hypothetical protein